MTFGLRTVKLLLPQSERFRSAPQTALSGESAGVIYTECLNSQTCLWDREGSASSMPLRLRLEFQNGKSFLDFLYCIGLAARDIKTLLSPQRELCQAHVHFFLCRQEEVDERRNGRHALRSLRNPPLCGELETCPSAFEQSSS